MNPQSSPAPWAAWRAKKTDSRHGSTLGWRKPTRGLLAEPSWFSFSPRLGTQAPMFVIELTYKADLAEVDAHMRAHMTFLNREYAAGRFVASGRKVPRDGGIILCLGQSRAEVEALMANDPFVKEGLADVRVIEFRLSQLAKDAQQRLDGEAAKNARRLK